MVFSMAAQQFEAAAGVYEDAAARLESVAAQGDECLSVIFRGQEVTQWDSPAGRAFFALTMHHVALVRARQEEVRTMATAARVIVVELREHAHWARVLAAATDALAGAGGELVSDSLLATARGASESAVDFLRFLNEHGSLPMSLLEEGGR